MERERLTITLRKDILKLVDQSIDGARLRNRSHAIEYYLSQQLSTKAAKVVLALTGGTSRTLYQAGSMQIGVKGNIAATPDVKNIFSYLATQSFQEVFLAGADQSVLQSAVADAQKFGLNAKAVSINLDGRVGVDGNIDSLKDYIKDESFVFWDSRFGGEVRLSDLLDFHKSARAQATGALLPASSVGATGMYAQLYGSKITNVGTEDVLRTSGLSLAGVFVFESNIFGEIASGKSLYREILPRLAQEGKLAGFAFSLATVPAAAIRK